MENNSKNKNKVKIALLSFLLSMFIWIMIFNFLWMLKIWTKVIINNYTHLSIITLVIVIIVFIKIYKYNLNSKSNYLLWVNINLVEEKNEEVMSDKELVSFLKERKNASKSEKEKTQIDDAIDIIDDENFIYDFMEETLNEIYDDLIKNGISNELTKQIKMMNEWITSQPDVYNDELLQIVEKINKEYNKKKYEF